MSSHLVSVGLLALLAGCPDPGGEFEAFQRRLPDAGTTVLVDAPVLAMVPDVSGTFLIGLTSDLVTVPIRFLSTQTVDMSGGTYKVTLTFQPLHKDTGLPVGNPVSFPQVQASSTTGEFNISLPGTLTIPAEANTLLNQPIVAENVGVQGRIVSVDRHCGTLTGMVTSPIPTNLGDAHTTYGAIRVASGTPPLPTPESKCP